MSRNCDADSRPRSVFPSVENFADVHCVQAQQASVSKVKVDTIGGAFPLLYNLEISSLRNDEVAGADYLAASSPASQSCISITSDAQKKWT